MSLGQHETVDGREAPERDTEVGGIAADRLRSIIERWERLQTEVEALRENQRDILLESKSAGFDVKVLRQLIARRRKEPAEVDEADTLLALYERALEGG